MHATLETVGVVKPQHQIHKHRSGQRPVHQEMSHFSVRDGQFLPIHCLDFNRVGLRVGHWLRLKLGFIGHWLRLKLGLIEHWLRLQLGLILAFQTLAHAYCDPPVMSPLASNCRRLIPSKHFFRWGCTFRGSYKHGRMRMMEKKQHSG